MIVRATSGSGSGLETVDRASKVTVRDVAEGVSQGIAGGDSEATTAPDPVANIRVTHNGSSLTVNWDAAARATHYDVTYYNINNGQNARAAWNRAGTSLTITCDVSDRP